MATHSNRQAIIFCSCRFYPFVFFFPSPVLSGRRLDVYHTFTHDVALVPIENACQKCVAHGLLKIQDTKITQKIAICAPPQNFVGVHLRN